MYFELINFESLINHKSFHVFKENMVAIKGFLPLAPPVSFGDESAKELKLRIGEVFDDLSIPLKPCAKLHSLLFLGVPGAIHAENIATDLLKVAALARHDRESIYGCLLYVITGRRQGI